MRDSDPDSETLQARGLKDAEPVPETAALTLIAHPNVHRISTWMPIEGEVQLSRRTPAFDPLGPIPALALDDPFVSRRPLVLEERAGGRWKLDARRTSTAVKVDGVPLTEDVLIEPAQMSAGVVIELGQNVAVLLHRERLSRPTDFTALGLLGHSRAIERVRANIRRVAPVDIPVLIRGESGVGKELVARAVHAASTRSAMPYEAVNMASIPANLAASELFGHTKGAFTGAEAARDGCFVRTDGGTLFLDEIGDTPVDVQPHLLRALETRDILAVGAAEPRTIDVRLISATDVELEAAVAAGHFRDALFHRVAGFQILVPPLRDRRDDIPLLFHHFVRAELEALGRKSLLEDVDPQNPWLPAAVVTRMLRYDWPGNVRQLKNVARQLVVRGHDQRRILLNAEVEALLPESVRFRPGATPSTTSSIQASKPTAPIETRDASSSASSGYRDHTEVKDDELLAALRAHDFRVGPAAEALAVSRSSMYALIDRSTRVRKASSLSEDEVREALRAAKGAVAHAAKNLEVSAHALKLRMKALGVDG